MEGLDRVDSGCVEEDSAGGDPALCSLVRRGIVDDAPVSPML